MPIRIPNAQIEYTLQYLTIDMGTLVGVAVLKRTVNGEPFGILEFKLHGNDLLAVLAEPALPGKGRGADMTDAIYAKVIELGIVPTGEIL